MKIGISGELSPKLKNLLLLFHQRLCQFWEALRQRPYFTLLLVAIFIYGITFSYFTVWKHDVFRSYAWDLGIFNQAVYTTFHDGRLFYYTAELYLNPSGSYFAQNVSPILFLILPFYTINSSAATLLIFKSFILAVAALPLYFLARELLKSKKVGFMIALVYLLYVPLQGANWFDFQQQVFLPVLFFSMFYFAVKSKWKFYFLTMALVTMVMERMAIITLFIAVYLLVTSKERPFWDSLKSLRKINQTSASVITIIFSLAYYFTADWFRSSFPINPQFVGTYQALSNWSVLGVTGNPMFYPLYIFTSPQRFLDALLFDWPLKLLFLALLFGPLLFISLRSTLVLATFPFLGMFLVSNYRPYYTIGAHYPLYVLALIFIAALIALKNFKPKTIITLLKIMLIISIVSTVALNPLSPFADRLSEDQVLWYPVGSLNSDENTVTLRELVKLVPSDASVLTQSHIFPHVSNRINAYVLHYDTVNDTEYLRFLINNSEYILFDLASFRANTNFVMNEISINNSYCVYALGNNAILFKRGFEGEPLFVHCTEDRVFSYKDLNLQPYVETVNDPTAALGTAAMCPKGTAGCYIFGPYTYLLPGSYEVTFEVKTDTQINGALGAFDISNSYGNSSVANREIFGSQLKQNEWTNFTLSFAPTELALNVEFRGFSYGAANIYVDRVFVHKVTNLTANMG